MSQQKAKGRRPPSVSSPPPSQSIAASLQKAFPYFVGLWLAAIFSKFGNPVIFSGFIDSPKNFLELAFNSWPLSWGYVLVGMVILLGLSVWRWKPATPRWVLILPLVWIGWQLLSARLSIDNSLTQKTLLDFAACTACFYLGLFCLGRMGDRSPLWAGLLLGLVLCLWTGLGQHFGGLEQTRRYLENIRWELYPPEIKAKLNSPEFLQKISSDRIFGTFVYPNALAGGIILTLPVCLLALWNFSERFSFILRGVIVGTLAYTGVACLVWSGSKAGWLIMLGMALFAFLHLEPLGKRLKIVILIILMGAGLGGFIGKYSGYFAKSNNSASARLDYWHAGWQLIKEKPVFGSGPGTFMMGYKRLKRPESEPTRLAHNDYLQQGADSGVVGMVSYLGLIAGSVVVLYRRVRAKKDWVLFAVWLGIAGLAVQELVEFSLYIPALAWPFFLFLGWLWGNAGEGQPAPPTRARQP